MTNALYLFLAFLSDVFINMFFTNGFVLNGPSANPNLFLITLILITLKDDFKKSLFTAFVVGLILDLFSLDTTFVYASVYTLTIVIVRLWSTRINDTFIELSLVTLSAIAVREVLLYIYNFLFNNIIFSINTWANSHLFYTIILNIPLIIIAVLIKINLSKKNIREKRKKRKYN